MDLNVRAALEREVDDLVEPPLGPLVGAAVQEGVRTAEEPFVEFARAHAARLRRTAYLMCHDWHLAEDWDDLSVDQTARLLELSPDVVKARSARALRRLRALLGEDHRAAVPAHSVAGIPSYLR